MLSHGRMPDKTQRRNRLINLGLLIISSLFGLALSEAGLRLIGWGPMYVSPEREQFWKYDAVLGWAHQPGQVGIFETRQFRTDVRINLDLPSKWRPLSNFRFFFEADNVFAYVEDGWASWLGGRIDRRRGWTRAVPDGDLLPIVTQGMGLFIVFGFEGKLVI